MSWYQQQWRQKERQREGDERGEWGEGGGRRGRGINIIIPLFNSQFIPLSGMQIGSVPGKQPETKPDQPECKLFLISLNTDLLWNGLQ